MKMFIGFILGVIAVPVIFALVGIAGWLPSNSTSEPPNWESSLGMRALDASLEIRSKGLSNPIQANDKAAFAEGAKLYARSCAGCHGSAKGPSGWGSTGLYPRAPQFFQEGSDVSPPEAYAAIHDGIRYSAMGSNGGFMKDDDIWKLANYVANMRAPGGKKMDMD